jgi:hypothetical protein
MSEPGWVAATDRSIQDFTVHLDVRFRIDDDVFTGRPNISAERLIRFIAVMDEMDAKPLAEQAGLIGQSFEMMLDAESAARFVARLADDENPISMDQVNRVQAWLMEQYGMRPTTPAGSSSAGPPAPAAGTSSTANGSAPASTSTPSPQPASST